MPMRLALPLIAAALTLTTPFARDAIAGSCPLEGFTDEAQNNGWIIQELTDEERINFLNHLNNDTGHHTRFYPPHLWETVRKENDRVKIRVVFLDADNCIIGNSGEIGFVQFSYLLAPSEGF